MEIDKEQIALLLQKRYNYIREIGRLTDEVAEAFSRQDEVSAAMLLNMRGDEMVKADSCNEELLRMGEENAEKHRLIRRLMSSDTAEKPDENDYWETKIYEIRIKTSKALEKIRIADRSMNRRVAGSRSCYADDLRK